MRVGSLFSGIGGLEYGLEMAGMEVIWQVEKNTFCQKVLKKYWPAVPKYEDVFDVKGDELIARHGTVDIICGGFPCQPFSVAGKQRGQEDDRFLWPEMSRIISGVRPTWIIAENVPGIVSMALDDVLFDLEGKGYTTGTIIIPACATGATHRRDRVWILGYSGCTLREGQLLEGNDAKTDRQSDADKTERSSEIQEDVAYPGSERCKEQQFTAGGDGMGQYTGSTAEGRADRPTQSRVGGVLDGLPDWLDRHRWPAGLGQSQYDWEPPRVATGVKQRIARLQALGNAVVPQIPYIIGKYIMEVERCKRQYT